MMLRAIRLALSLQRFELRLLLGATLLVTVAALALAWQTRVVREEQLACYRAAPPAVEGSLDSPCPEQDPTLELLNDASAFAKVGVLGTPFVLGLFLGVPIVAREIEARTASLAWSLSRSRRRWLLLRAAPVLAVVALASLAAGLAGDVLTHAAPWFEGSDPGFEDSWSRGPLVAVRGMAVGGIGLAIGALLGRQLPGLLAGGLVTIALVAVVTITIDGWMRDAAEPIAVGPEQVISGKIYGSDYRDDATGEIVSDEELYLADGEMRTDEYGIPLGMTQVYYMVPGTRYGEFVLRESALFLVAALLASGVAVAAVSVRRP
jgi:hypothetical protein